MSKPQEPHAYPNPERLKYYQDDYRKFHTAQPKKLSGKLKVEQINIIVGLVAGLMSERATGFKPRLLDYGSGKGYQYLLARIHENWGGHLPICYDPGVIQLATRPPGRFDGIICTDVLEHIEAFDLDHVLEDIFRYAALPVSAHTYSFVYLHICCREAHKHFEDGRNLHRTVQPPKWWNELLAKHVAPFSYIKLVTSYEEAKVPDE